MKGFFIALVIALLFVLALLLGSRNEQLVTINYFVAQGDFRLPVVLASVFFAGFLLCWCFAIYHIGKLKYALSRANRKLQKLQATADSSDQVSAEAGEVKS
ncbi:LapA family protein [Shewanella khirikhana]|uniref:Probable lipopolysaccharide assembly protein A n=1 Tax=Shewanella khirikhana TaxID=1965282 RepID=A0ABM7DNC3_9GAMM|nr:LapA family protein [Shewanella khirikhana]AZQ10536.1 Inner membrane protein YciS [Shewanella khirikhana]